MRGRSATETSTRLPELYRSWALASSPCPLEQRSRGRGCVSSQRVRSALVVYEKNGSTYECCLSFNICRLSANPNFGIFPETWRLLPGFPHRTGTRVATQLGTDINYPRVINRSPGTRDRCTPLSLLHPHLRALPARSGARSSGWSFLVAHDCRKLSGLVSPPSSGVNRKVARWNPGLCHS